MIRRGLLTAALTALLSACAMGPDYERPEVPVPEGWRGGQESAETIANLRWWEVFDDEELNRLIQIALENNKELAVAIARIEEARAELGFVRADLYPQVGGQAGAARGNAVNGVPAPNVDNAFVLAGNLSYEVDLWGKLRRSTESARAQLLATVEARNAVTITLVADVASVYLLLVDLDGRVGVAERTLVTRQESLEIIQARFDKGIVPLIDVNQAEIELADAEAELYALQRSQQQAENLLSVLLGRNPGPVRRGNTQKTDLTIFNIDIPAGMPSELLERRPDIRQAHQQLHAQTARIGVAEAMRWPSLSLTGTLGLVSNDLDNFISSDNKAWSISANLFGPIFDAGRNKARVEAEIARTEQLLNNYQFVILQSFREVEDTLVDVHTFRQEAEARQRQMVAARSAANLSRARYDGGVTSYLEVLESERSLFRAELLALSTKREHLVAIVTLYKALGGGWLSEEEYAEMAAKKAEDA